MNTVVVIDAAAAALAAVIWLGALDKLRHFAEFCAAVDAYRLLPGQWARGFAVLFVCTELAAGTLLLPAAQRSLGAGVAALAICVASAAVVVNLLRGHTDIDCGCGGLAHFASGLSWWMLVRNAGLLLLAALATVTTDRPAAAMAWLDRITFLGLAVVLTGVYYLANQLIDLHLRVRQFRSQT